MLPVVEALAREESLVSVDTRRPAVMRAAHRRRGGDGQRRRRAAGAGRDRSRRRDERRGLPRCTCRASRERCRRPRITTTSSPRCARSSSRARGACEAAGIARDRIVIDPGFGFGKTLAHNLALLRALPRSRGDGLSRAGRALAQVVARRDHGTRRSTSGCRRASPRRSRRWRAAPSIVRVHDVRETVDALKVWQRDRGGLDANELNDATILRHRRRPRPRRRCAHHARARAEARLGGRPRARGRARARRHASRGADRQGHADLRLPARGGARSRAVGGGRRRLPVRTAADAGGRLSHARAAAVRGHRHQRVAQSVRRQRDQVLRRDRREAARRGRAGDRAHDGAAARVRRARPISARRAASTTRRVATSSSARARSRTSATSRACGSSSTARTAPAITSRRRCSTSSARR